MLMRPTHGMWWFPVRLATAVLVVGLILASYPAALSESSQTAVRDEIDSPEGEGGLAHAAGGLVLFRGDSSEAPVFLTADVVVDEEFVEHVGDGWEDRVFEMVEETNALFVKVGLGIEVGSISRWRSDDAEDSIAAQLVSAEQQIQRVSGRLFLAITCQDTVKFDGWAQKSKGRAIVQYYHEGRTRNSALIAHEIGHILGARHHDDDEECTGDGCIMDRKGFAHGTGWCRHHEQVIHETITAALGSHGPEL